MKIKFIIILIILPQIILSQNKLEQSKEEKVYKEIISVVCSCVKIDRTNELSIDDNCITENKLLINSKIENEFGKELANDLKQKWMKNFKETMSSPLVQNCDKYYNYFKSLKYQSIESIYNFKNATRLDSLNQIEPSKRGENFFFARGVLNFASKKYKIAIEDLEKSVRQNPNAERYFILALAYNENKDLEKTLKTFKELKTITSKSEFEVWRAVTKREFQEKQIN